MDKTTHLKVADLQTEVYFISSHG